jgi:hypothetical protein
MQAVVRHSLDEQWTTWALGGGLGRPSEPLTRPTAQHIKSLLAAAGGATNAPGAPGAADSSARVGNPTRSGAGAALTSPGAQPCSVHGLPDCTTPPPPQAVHLAAPLASSQLPQLHSSSSHPPLASPSAGSTARACLAARSFGAAGALEHASLDRRSSASSGGGATAPDGRTRREAARMLCAVAEGDWGGDAAGLAGATAADAGAGLEAELGGCDEDAAGPSAAAEAGPAVVGPSKPRAEGPSSPPATGAQQPGAAARPLLRALLGVLARSFSASPQRDAGRSPGGRLASRGGSGAATPRQQPAEDGGSCSPPPPGSPRADDDAAGGGGGGTPRARLALLRCWGGGTEAEPSPRGSAGDSLPSSPSPSPSPSAASPLSARRSAATTRGDGGVAALVARATFLPAAAQAALARDRATREQAAASGLAEGRHAAARAGHAGRAGSGTATAGSTHGPGSSRLQHMTQLASFVLSPTEVTQGHGEAPS